MPEWMIPPEAPDPKLAVFLLLVGIILSLSYVGQKTESQAKAGGGIEHRKKRELPGVGR